MRGLLTIFLFSFALFAQGCVKVDDDQGSGTKTDGKGEASTELSSADGAEVGALKKHCSEIMSKQEHESARIKVQRILIAFKGSVQGKEIGRNKEQAEKLAAEVFTKVQAGEDFDVLVRTHTDAPPPDFFYLHLTKHNPPSNHGRSALDEPSFGDVSWRLGIGEVGVAAYDPEKSKSGWHIIKRLE